MFLPGVEQNPQPGPYADMIRMMQASGAEYPQIWHMFAYLPKATEHLARFTQEILRGPGAVQSGNSRADRGVHVVSQRLPVLTEVARRGRGGTVGRRGAGVGRVARSGELASWMKNTRRCSGLSTR